MTEPCYLFSSFRDNGQDGLHLAYSTDGLLWTALNEDRPFLRSEVGQEKLMRDPCIAQGPDGIFHLVWTDSWQSHTIGYARSSDLIHWSPQQALPVMAHEPTALNCWAPEVIYDTKTQEFLIFWSTTIPGRFPETEGTGDEKYNHRIYACTTKDFHTFSPTQLFFDPGFNVIDATILITNTQTYLIVKDETKVPIKKNLRLAVGDQVTGPYSLISDAAITPSWVEGPTALQLGSDVFIYFDCYTQKRYGAIRSSDLEHWHDISDLISFPVGTRHGSICPVNLNILTHLRETKLNAS